MKGCGQMAISKRLETIAKEVPKGACFADIGTDHGYMPIYVLENDDLAYGVLCDLNEAPLALAKKNVELKGIGKDRYALRLGNGLEACLEIELDTLTISGMGAGLILEILSSQKEKLNEIKTLVLSPNIAPWLLRDELGNYGFNLKKEQLVYENGLYYEVLVFQKEGVEPLTETEIYFGKFLPKDSANQAYFEKRKEKDFYKIAQMKSAKASASVKDEIARIEALWKGFSNG